MMKKILLIGIFCALTFPAHAYIRNAEQALETMAFYDANNERIACDNIDHVLNCIEEDERPYSGAATAITKNEDPLISAELAIKNGKINGIFKLYEGGHLSVDGFFVNGLQEGIETKYFPNGKVRTVSGYLKGELHGVVQEYDEKGTLISTVSWKFGKQDGEMRENYPNGNLKSISSWKDNKQQGKTIFYGEDGRITERALWFRGKLIKHSSN